MPQLQTVPFTASVASLSVEATGPTILQTALQALLDDEANGGNRLVGIDLAGAGTGHVFVATGDFLSGGGAAAGVRVYCYEAANFATFNQAYAAARAAAIAASPGLDLVAHLTAGASQGTRIMGVLVLAPSGTYPSTGVIANGFGFYNDAAPIAIPNGSLFSASADVRAAIALDLPANDFVLGSGGNAGTMVYIGPPIIVEVTLDVVFSSGTAGQASVFDLLVSGVQVAHAVEGDPGTNSRQSASVSVLRAIANGDTFDCAYNGDADPTNVSLYHISVR